MGQTHRTSVPSRRSSSRPPPTFIRSRGSGRNRRSSWRTYYRHERQVRVRLEQPIRELQDEEEARSRSHGPGAGASNDYYGQPGQAQPPQYGGYPQQNAGQYGQPQQSYDTQIQDKGKSKGGLLGKLMSKASGHGSSSSSAHAYPPQQHYGQPGYGAPMGGQQYYQQPMMGGGGMGGMGGRRPGGGMGGMGGMALGAGGGLLGGALLGSALADAGDGGDGGGDYGGDGGGDYGGDGGDFGGGDMGGDMGGGDF
jgi:hypothetical protein